MQSSTGKRMNGVSRPSPPCSPRSPKYCCVRSVPGVMLRGGDVTAGFWLTEQLSTKPTTVPLQTSVKKIEILSRWPLLTLVSVPYLSLSSRLNDRWAMSHPGVAVYHFSSFFSNRIFISPPLKTLQSNWRTILDTMLYEQYHSQDETWNTGPFIN